MILLSNGFKSLNDRSKANGAHKTKLVIGIALGALFLCSGIMHNLR